MACITIYYISELDSLYIYIGVTAKHRKWILYGVLYAIPFIFYNVFMEKSNPISLRFEIILTSVWLLAFFSMVHAFFLRKEYLIRLEMLKETKKDKFNEILHDTSLDNQEHPKNIEKPNMKTEATDFIKDFPSKSVSARVDINNDPEDLLIGLPGVNLILAKKAIQLRRSGVYFDSAEDFGEALGLKPHIVEKIKSYIVINPLKDVPVAKTIQSKGRRIDI